jgi:hypothetical protein
VDNVGVLPCLPPNQYDALSCGGLIAHLWEGTVVPQVALVWEAVADETKLALLDVLLDGVEGLLLGDLYKCQSMCSAVRLMCNVHWDMSSTIPFGIVMWK